MGPAFHMRQNFVGSICFSFSAGPGDPLRLCTKRFLFKFQEHKVFHYDMWTHTCCTNSVVNIPKWD